MVMLDKLCIVAEMNCSTSSRQSHLRASPVVRSVQNDPANSTGSPIRRVFQFYPVGSGSKAIGVASNGTGLQLHSCDCPMQQDESRSKPNG